jgi:hypothetical protein
MNFSVKIFQGERRGGGYVFHGATATTSATAVSITTTHFVFRIADILFANQVHQCIVSTRKLNGGFMMFFIIIYNNI